MASGIRVRINSAGAKAILTSAGVANDLAERAIAIATKACRDASPDEMHNAPFMADGDADGARARARAFTASTHGIRSQNKRNTLLKALDAGR